MKPARRNTIRIAGAALTLGAFVAAAGLPAVASAARLDFVCALTRHDEFLDTGQRYPGAASLVLEISVDTGTGEFWINGSLFPHGRWQSEGATSNGSFAMLVPGKEGWVEFNARTKIYKFHDVKYENLRGTRTGHTITIDLEYDCNE